MYFYKCCTCFRQFLCPSSGAHNCTYSCKYCQPILLLAAMVVASSNIGWKYLKLYVQLCSWWWVEEPPETCRAFVKINKFKKSCILLAVIWNYITMHGHMNTKFHSVVNENSYLLGYDIGHLNHLRLRHQISSKYEEPLTQGHNVTS
jgi:hypothetical protein